MEKIALIRTPIIQPKHHVGSLRAVPSIGIAYINAQLKNAGYQTIVIDAPGEGINQYSQIKNTELIINGLIASQIAERIPADVDVIGISVMHANEWVYDRYIIKHLKAQFPNASIMIGGENATGSVKIIMDECPEIDVAVLGEADLIVNKVVHNLIHKLPMGDIPGICFRDHGQVSFTGRNSNIKNLEALLKPAWEDFPLENYFYNKSSVSGFNKRSITMIATRGCPYSCTFCTVPNMWNAKWNARDPFAVILEIKEMIQRYKIEHIDFVDLTFALNRTWTVEFCNRLINEGVKISWSLPIGTRVENLDSEIIQLMKKAGCIRVLYSPESGSEETLLRIKKKLKLHDMDRAILESVKNDIIVKLATIFGFPGQTLKEALNTYLFIIKSAFLGVHDVVCLCFVPYPGTELYDNLVKENRLIPEVEIIRLNNDIKNMKSWSEHISNNQVRLIAFVGMATFYTLQYLIRPLRIFSLVNNVFMKKEPSTNLETLIFNKLYKKNIKYLFVEEVV